MECQHVSQGIHGHGVGDVRTAGGMGVGRKEGGRVEGENTESRGEDARCYLAGKRVIVSQGSKEDG